MREQSTTLGIPLSRTELAPNGQNWPRFSGVMRVVRSCLGGGKYDALADELAAALNCSQRTARRIIAGQDVGTDSTLAALTHPTIGPRLFEEILSRVPRERRAALAKALMDAAELAYVQTRQEQLLNRNEAK